MMTMITAEENEAMAKAIEFAILTRSPLVQTFGVDTSGKRWIVLVRGDLVDECIDQIRETAEEYRHGCDDAALAANRIAWAAKADAWLALDGKVGIACYWRGTDLIVPATCSNCGRDDVQLLGWLCMTCRQRIYDHWVAEVMERRDPQELEEIAEASAGWAW